MASILSIDKLKGRENFSTRKFACQAYLECEELWEAIENDRKTEVKSEKDRRARAKIVLLVDPIIYPHIETAKTAKEVWQNLNKAFEDSGLTRKVGLLRQLINMRLDSHRTVEEYVNSIISTSQRLNKLGFKVGDEWIGALLLAGLPDSYKPMIMGLESSGIPITGDSVKVKLLQEVKLPMRPRNLNESVLYSKSGYKGNKIFGKQQV